MARLGELGREPVVTDPLHWEEGLVRAVERAAHDAVVRQLIELSGVAG